MAEGSGRQFEIPGFRDFEEIGRGGFAVVYRAEQEIFQRHVAVKVITLLDVTDDARRRFQRECTAIGRLAWHPHIVTVFDAGDTPEGWPYLVMEYLPAGSFGDRMRSGPLPWAEVVDLGVKISGALQAAHDEGSIHRDVKPDNILLSRTGDPKLGDFGIATLQDGTRSRSGSLTATLAYAAPEVLGGDRASVSSDVYSLAATLHALCAGAAPFVRDSDEHVFAVIRRVDSEPPADLRPLGVPDAVAAAIEAGMAKDPAHRPATAAAFAQVLAASATGTAPDPPAGRAAPTQPIAGLAAAVAPVGSPAPAATPAAATTAAAGEGSSAPVDHDATVVVPIGAPGEASRSRGRLVAALAAVAVVIAAVVGFVALSGGDDGGSATLVASPSLDPEAGQIVTVVGTGTSGDSGDGDATTAQLDGPRGVVVDDTLAISDTGRSRVRILAEGFLTTVAGAPAAGEVAAPAGIDIFDGGVVFADAEGHQVLWVSPSGAVSVLAGTGVAGYSGDGGPATEATLDAPSGVAVAPDGTVYVADSFNHVVRRIDVDGTITTVAGTGEASFGGDGGPATEADLSAPRGVAVDPDGVVYVADTDNHMIRRLDPDGTISTVAGIGQAGFGGDGGPATDAALDGPHGLAIGPDGAIYVADTFNNRIRRIDAEGTITTVAGNGAQGLAGDGGPAIEAELLNPQGVSVGIDGDIYIADTGNSAIRRVGASG